MEMKIQDEKKVWLDKEQERSGISSIDGFRKGGRTTLEKVLAVVVVVLLLVIVAVVIVLILEKITNRNQQSSNSDVCLTKDCVDAAARIHSYIDYSVPYCDDFYQFACGSWMKKNVVPDDKGAINTFVLLRDNVDIVLKGLLEAEVLPTDIRSIKMAKDFYKSCMDLDKINEIGDQPMRDLLKNEFGGWPLTTPGWSEDSFDFLQTMIRLSTLSRQSVISFYVSIDQKNSSRFVLKMEQTSFGMPGQKYYQVPRNDTMLMAYEDLIFQIGQLVGFADPSTARKEVASIVDFEILLANITVPDEDRRDSNTLYNPMTLAEVHGNYSKVFDWRSYVRAVLVRPETGLSEITDEELIINQSPLYYERLNELLSQTNKRTLANYLIWRLVRGLMFLMGDNYKAPVQAYRKAVYGASAETSRFRICAGYTAETLALAVGQMFIKDNFDADSKAIAMNMINGLQDAFNELLEELDWMDEDTKRVAREKNEYISARIGYPPELTNDTYLDEYYVNYTYYRDQYFNNNLMLMKEGANRSARMLRKIVDKTRWERTVSMVNAFYSTLSNQISFPAGILQPPFFSKGFPKSINYGGIGYFIGHEITHGFDDRGRQYDRFGNLAQWWSPSAVEKFKDKARCIIEQYGNFTVPEVNMKMNGINTQGENIADNGGLKQAFRAYRTWVDKQGKEEPLLPGLDFNHNQLFFINFAQMWCSLLTKESAVARIKTEVHSPDRFRVIGPIQNSPDFARVFDCPINSRMNPQNKCTVW